MTAQHQDQNGSHETHEQTSDDADAFPDDAFPDNAFPDNKEPAMLLSRVADDVYWSGRYLERTEATARMLRVHTELFLDLPKSAGVGWSPLLAITGSAESFREQYGETDTVAPTEDAIVRFLTADPVNPASIISSLRAARTNFRVTRAVFPAASWEELNKLYHFVIESLSLAVDRRTRMAWLERVIRDCQVLRGVLGSTMSHDEAYSFLEIGRAIECADMTTRVLDVQAGVLLAEAKATVTPAYSDITWASVLKSLSAHQMFRRTVRNGISGPGALRFLLRDPQFPKSVEHSLTRISRALLELPRYEHAMSGCAHVQQLLENAAVGDLASTGLHDFVDDLQIGIARLHDALTSTYFVRSVPAGKPATLVASA